MRNLVFPLLVIALPLCIRPAAAQDISPYVLAVAGECAEGATFSVSWTVGQLSSETRVHHSGILSEGFQQVFLTVVGVREACVPLSMELYPNPARQQLLIELTGADENVTITMYNMLGEPVSRQVLLVGDRMLRIPLEGLPDGMYILAAISSRGDRLAVYKVIKAD